MGLKYCIPKRILIWKVQKLRWWQIQAKWLVLIFYHIFKITRFFKILGSSFRINKRSSKKRRRKVKLTHSRSRPPHLVGVTHVLSCQEKWRECIRSHQRKWGHWISYHATMSMLFLFFYYLDMYTFLFKILSF